MDRVKEMRMVMMVVMLMKTIIAAMIPLPMALRHHREREEERSSPLCFLLHGLPLDGERFSLWSLAFMAMMAPPGSSTIASGDGPLR